MRIKRKFNMVGIFTALFVMLTAGSLRADTVAGPYLLGSNCVSWVSDKIGTGCVEWTDPSGQAHRVVESRDGLVELVTVHRVSLTGLPLSATNQMRVITRPLGKFGASHVDFGASTTNKFILHTPAANPGRIHFAVLNDVHSKEPLMRQLLALVATNRPDAVFLNGDIINNPGSDKVIIPPILQPLGEVLGSSVPFWFIRGNHETRDRLARSLSNYILAPGEPWYRAFTFGPARIVLLDSGEDKEDGNKWYSGLADFDRYREQQARWLTAEVASEAFRNARYRVIFSHIPPFSKKKDPSWHGAQQVCQLWAPLCQGVNLTAWFSGHTHVAEVVDPQTGQHDYPVVIGGGSDVSSATVIDVEADGNQMKIRILSAAGAVIAERVLK